MENFIFLTIQDFIQLDETSQAWLRTLGIELAIFLLALMGALLLGRATPAIIKFFLKLFLPQQVSVKVAEDLIHPIRGEIQVAGTIIFISLCLRLLRRYENIYAFLTFFIDLAIIVSVAWLISRFFRQFLQVYGINLIRRLGLEVDEMLLVFETFINIVIGLIAAITFAQSQNVNLFGLFAGLGIGGIAIAFAAQKTLEQLLGTVVLYLDRPYIRGDYIRVQLAPNTDPVYGRVESIGLRSTKLRTAAKGTLVIVPNSLMANLDIENVTRGKKVMVLLYLDFGHSLDEREQALVEQVVKASTNVLFGIDPGSTRITLFQPDDKPGTRARVTFFILGSSENSIQLRKRLLELANESIDKKLENYGIHFKMQEPTIYVESPVKI